MDPQAKDERDPLKIALGASKPIPASDAEERRELLEVERLVPRDKISVGQHEQFRQSISRPCDRFDDIDEAMADPIHDHRPQSAPKHRTNRVLSILDELDAKNPNRRFPV